MDNFDGSITDLLRINITRHTLEQMVDSLTLNKSKTIEPMKNVKISY